MTGSGFEERAQAVIRAAIETGLGDGIQGILQQTRESLTRFANNAIHQNVAEENAALMVRVRVGKRTASVGTNRLDRAAIRRAAENALRLARVAREDPDLPDLPGPRPFAPLALHDTATAALGPADRAERVRKALAGLPREAVAAGYFSQAEGAFSVGNSAGLLVHTAYTSCEFSITVFQGERSGWTKANAHRVAELDTEALANRAAAKAAIPEAPTPVSPGAYRVVLEPSAVADLIGFLLPDFGGLTVHERRSCFTDRSGRVAGENISLIDDARHPLQFGVPFDGDGIPRQRVGLIERGELKNLVYSLASARKIGAAPTGHGYVNHPGESPMNAVMAGGEGTAEDLVAGVERGLFITRFWYIREVDPTQKVLTGMTRDGTFLIENGRIVGSVKNLRFNQSVLQMLNEVEAMGRPVRAPGEEHYGTIVAPPIRVSRFTFTS